MLASIVGLNITSRRRWIGAVFLLAAMGMLIAGETLLKSHLRNLTFLLYWLLCLICTGAAIIVACLDVRAVQRESRHEARELIQNTLNKVESDVRRKPPGPKSHDQD